MATPARKDPVQLEPLMAMSLKDQVIRQLTRLVEDGAFAPGEQLPSERELAEQLKVSRGTVREAVQFLHALGVVEIRHGSGTFVREASTDGQGIGDEWRRWTARHADRVHLLLEVRRGLESFAAELAAERADAPALERMSEPLKRMEEAIARRSVPALVESDVEFHQALGAASGNAALAELVESLGGQLIPERGAIWDNQGRPERSLTEHNAIFDAVRSGARDRARASVIDHLASVEHDLDALLSRLPDERDTDE